MFNINSGAIGISAVTLGELVHGVEKSDNPQSNLQSLEGFVGRLEVINYDEAAAYHFGQLRCELKGQEIGPYDFMIAAHARSLGLTLISNNRREFKRVDGLRVENWVKS
jgi:tRNA(fMet)-specific endonuclease VapC